MTSDLLARLRPWGTTIREFREEGRGEDRAVLMSDIERIIGEWERSQLPDFVPSDGGYRVVYACRKCARIGFGANECECEHGEMERCALVPTTHLTRLIYMAGIKALKKPAPPKEPTP